MQQCNLSDLSGAQFPFTDRRGGMLVVSPGSDGEVVFQRSGRSYEVVANTNEATSAHAMPYDRRHQTANDELQRIVDGATPCSAEQLPSILSRVAQRHGSSETSYSYVFDLTNGLLYLYAWHEFSRFTCFRISELLDVDAQVFYEIGGLHP